MPLFLNNWPFAAHSFIGLPLTGDSAFEINLLFRSELIRVNEEPVSNKADSLNFLMVTVEMGLAGGEILKQLDNTAQKLMTAAGKRFELLPFFLRSFP